MLESGNDDGRGGGGAAIQRAYAYIYIYIFMYIPKGSGGGVQTRYAEKPGVLRALRDWPPH